MPARLTLTLLFFVVSASAAIVGVTGMGSHPVSANTLAFWLLQEDGTPLVMAFYHGPPQWHDTQWKIDSQFTDRSVGWGELKSAKAALHLRVDLGAGRAEIQHKPFSLAQNNTFLILHMTDGKQQIIPLGRRKLLKSTQIPAAMLLLNSDKALRMRIEQATKGI